MVEKTGMTDNESKLEVGDFARNKIHWNIIFLYGLQPSSLGPPFPDLLFGVCVDSPSVDDSTTIKDPIPEGMVRLEIPRELEKVSPHPRLISKARKYLLQFYTEKQIDNLSYIECLNKLNEQEKELK